jgi:hypothetical protein
MNMAQIGSKLRPGSSVAGSKVKGTDGQNAQPAWTLLKPVSNLYLYLYLYLNGSMDVSWRGEETVSAVIFLEGVHNRYRSRSRALVSGAGNHPRHTLAHSKPPK